LAIDQAAAYIAFNQISLSDVFFQYEDQKARILQYTRGGLWEYRKFRNDIETMVELSVFTTWEMSFQQILPSNKDRKEQIA
jgi:hypothetical protein